MKKLTLLLFALAISLLSCSLQAAEKPSYRSMSADTKTIAQQYFDAYVALDWEKLEPLLADNSSFEDPTAEHVFGVVKRKGKEAIMKGFRDGYASIVKMQFHPSRSSFSGQHAIFEGNLEWSMKINEDTLVEVKSMPFINILKVEEGKIVSHIDYADYAPFFEAYRSALK